MKNYLAIGLALAMVVGCGKKDEPKTVTPPSSMTRQDVQSSAVTPPLPPVNAVDDGTQRPAPGQANDHSSPAFKAGGKTDPKK